MTIATKTVMVQQSAFPADFTMRISVVFLVFIYESVFYCLLSMHNSITSFSDHNGWGKNDGVDFVQIIFSLRYAKE